MTRDDFLARWGVTVLEEEPETIYFTIQTARGEVVVIASVFRFARTLVFDGVHVSGEGLDLRRIREVAKAFGQAEDVEEVVLQGGVRRSGARPGWRPTPIRVRVD